MSTPYDSMVHFVKNHGDGISQIKYAQITGSLMFLTTCIRFDIAYDVGKFGIYTHNPRVEY
jgi:hypothetical protein